MAPEIHAEQPYSGPSVDLFASGIILFKMLIGNPPSQKADSKYPRYNLIFLGKFESFWGVHQNFKPKYFFSKDFKDLLNRLVPRTLRNNGKYKNGIPSKKTTDGSLEIERKKLKKRKERWWNCKGKRQKEFLKRST